MTMKNVLKEESDKRYSARLKKHTVKELSESLAYNRSMAHGSANPPIAEIARENIKLILAEIATRSDAATTILKSLRKEIAALKVAAKGAR